MLRTSRAALLTWAWVGWLLWSAGWDHVDRSRSTPACEMSWGFPEWTKVASGDLADRSTPYALYKFDDVMNRPGSSSVNLQRTRSLGLCQGCACMPPRAAWATNCVAGRSFKPCIPLHLARFDPHYV